MDWKRFAVAASYYGTLPWRHLANRRACERGAAPICVLFYHRVAQSYANDWTISPELFERQMDWLQDHNEMISLREAQHRMRVGKNDRPAVCVTFDDGYSDNCNYAIPLLVERKIPCTYFVALQFITQRLAFPHDLQRGVPLEPNSIPQLQKMAADGIEIGAHTRTHADIGQIRDPNQLYDELVTSGRELEQLVQQPVTYFAFPYGQLQNLSAEAFRLARDTGYEGVLSAYGGYNFPGDDAFHLQRIHADPEMLRFRNWMTVDPRKVALVEPLQSEVAGMASLVEVADGSPVG